MKTNFLKLVTAACLSLVTLHCGYGPQPDTFQKRGLVCQEDGFCLKHNDDDYFYGAFRAGERELQFKVENLRWSAIGFIKGSTGGRNLCIMTEYQHEFISGGMACADDPMLSEAGYELDHRSVAEKFLQYLETNEPTAGRRGEWDVVKGMVRTILNGYV